MLKQILMFLFSCALIQNNALAQTSALKANAGPDQIVEQENRAGAKVTLKGSVEQSPAATSENLTYIWAGPFGSVEGDSSNVILPSGTNEISLVVKNGATTSEPDKVTITVQDTVPPKIFIPPNPVIFFASGPKVPLVIKKPVVRDRVGPVTITRDGPKDFLPVDSTTTVTWTAMDSAGNRSSATQTLTVLPFESILHVHKVSLTSSPNQNGKDSDLSPSHPDSDFLKIEGQFIISGPTDGIDIASEELTIVFGKNSETINHGSLAPTASKDSYIYKSENKGIREIQFQADGSFTLIAEGWGGKDKKKEAKVMFFSFKIGNDRGELYLPLDKNCSLESHKH